MKMAEKVKQFDSEYFQEQRQVRKQRQKKIQYIVFGILLLLIILILLYMFTPLSKISNVKISGNDLVSDKEINQMLKLNNKARMYTYSTNNAKERLESNELIKKAEVSKKFPKDLHVKITEHQIAGVVKEKGEYVPILENGKSIKNRSNDELEEGPILSGFKEKQRAQLVSELAKMPKNVRNMISEITYDPETNKRNQIQLFTSDNIQVIADLRTVGDKMKYYGQMSQSLQRDDSGALQKDGYIDLTVGASFIPYDGASSQQAQSDKNVEQGTQKEDKAKDELQSTLNKIQKNTDESD